MTDSQVPLYATDHAAWYRPDPDTHAPRRAGLKRSFSALATARLESLHTGWHRWAERSLSFRHRRADPHAEDCPAAVFKAVATVPAAGYGHFPLTAPDGSLLLAGLTWEIALGAEYPRFGKNREMVLRRDQRRAVITLPPLSDQDVPVASLLLVLAQSLQQTVMNCEGPWAFIAEVPHADGRPLLWLAIADIEKPFDRETTANVIPRPGPERICETADECLAALQAQLEIVEIAGIAVRWLPPCADMSEADTHRGPMIAGFSQVAHNVPLHDVPLAPPSEGQRFTAPVQISPRLAGGVGLLAAASLVIGLVLVPLAQAYFTPAPPPPIEYVTVMPERGGFAANCAHGLAGWWPRIIGWDLVTSGCALPPHLPPRLAFMRQASLPAINPGEVAERDAALPRPAQPMMIWQEFVPSADRNPVMAQAAANQVIDRWEHQVELNTQGRGRLTLWREADIPLTPALAPDRSAATMAYLPDGTLDWQNLQVQLATLWLDTPNAVALKDEQFVIRSATRPATAFERAGLIEALAPVRLEYPGELILAPIATRTLPASMFTEGETNG